MSETIKRRAGNYSRWSHAHSGLGKVNCGTPEIAVGRNGRALFRLEDSWKFQFHGGGLRCCHGDRAQCSTKYILRAVSRRGNDVP